jgi:pimeloyl-ACP methyl ester carboxylesterase
MISMTAKDDILFLPGLNCTSALFQPQIDAISPNWSCFVGDHGTADTMEDIVRAILAEAPRRFAVVGLSMGGYLALEIMRQQPERVSAMILLDTRAAPDSREDIERRRRTIEIVERGQFDSLHTILWPRLVHPDRVTDRILESTVKQMMADTGTVRFIRQQTALLKRPDYLPLLGKIKIPVLVGVGRQDVITPPEMSEALYAAIPGAELTIFEECGHLSTLERPELLSLTISSFLDQNKSLNN